MRPARPARLPGAAAAGQPQARLILAAVLAGLAAAPAGAEPPFPPSDFAIHRAEAQAREAAAAKAAEARRQERLNRRAKPGAAAGPPAPAAGLGEIVDPTRLIDLAILGVLGAAAISAITYDSGPLGEASSGAAAPAPGGGTEPPTAPGATATGTN